MSGIITNNAFLHLVQKVRMIDVHFHILPILFEICMNRLKSLLRPVPQTSPVILHLEKLFNMGCQDMNLGSDVDWAPC